MNRFGAVIVEAGHIDDANACDENSAEKQDENRSADDDAARGLSNEPIAGSGKRLSRRKTTRDGGELT